MTSAPFSVDWHRVTIRFVGHQTVAIELGLRGHTTIVGKRRQAAQQGTLPFPHLPNGLHLPADPAAIILKTGGSQLPIQLLEGGHIRDGNQEVPATKSHRCLYPTLLPSGGWLAEMAFEQVVRAKGDKRPLLSPDSAFYHQPDSGREVVVADAGGHTSEVLKGTHMPIEERLLLLRGKGHDKAPPAVGQPHDKDLHRLLHSSDDRDRLSPIDLGILAGFKLQWQKECRGFVGLVPLAHMQANPCLRALVAFLSKAFIDLVRRVLLGASAGGHSRPAVHLCVDDRHQRPVLAWAE